MNGVFVPDPPYKDWQGVRSAALAFRDGWEEGYEAGYRAALRAVTTVQQELPLHEPRCGFEL